mmetsp:Transcript_58826/g.135716  ORF Transcript_58826/g.135716 Transcript_58826/m.135716 type:complete len:295 (-) Transcript_58826:150-1034(-)
MLQYRRTSTTHLGYDFLGAAAEYLTVEQRILALFQKCGLLACVGEHAQTFDLGEDGLFWIDAFANNQHRLQEELGVDPLQFPFVRAISDSQGVLLALGENAECLTRSWCALEHAVLHSYPREYAIASASGIDKPVVLTTGPAPCDVARARQLDPRNADRLAQAQQAGRQARFSPDCLASLLQIDFSSAASNPDEDATNNIAFIEELGGFDQARLPIIQIANLAQRLEEEHRQQEAQRLENESRGQEGQGLENERRGQEAQGLENELRGQEAQRLEDERRGQARECSVANSALRR